jgi:hypothetical protein
MYNILLYIADDFIECFQYFAAGREDEIENTDYFFSLKSLRVYHYKFTDLKICYVEGNNHLINRNSQHDVYVQA